MEPDNVAVDGAGNVYFSDTGSHHVCRINTSGQITVVAGTGAAAFSGENIAGPLASLNLPTSLSVDSAGNVYIADTGNNRVRKLTVSTGILTTVAGTAQFDGDGKIDPTVYRPSSHQWFILYSSRNYDAALYGYLQWGLDGDEPFAADFDGDGYCDIGVFRPSNGTWYLRLSSLGWQPGPNTVFAWGATGDVPNTGDVDADGRADIGVYRPTTGQWFFLFSSLNYSATSYGYFG